MQQGQSAWSRIVEAIDKPLGFYVLGLLIVEGFLAQIVVFSTLDPSAKERGMWAIVVLFGVVVFVVSLLTWFKPTHLTFTGFDSLVQSGHAAYGTSARPVTASQLPSGTEPSTERSAE